ncbi:MAG: helix-turn-helix domain-containing protein, partial [Candidatus Aminicenantes bacterium]|nr:helix-turn-helix domain-containing protein [Candidatus Aminicenantes bacterium]
MDNEKKLKAVMAKRIQEIRKALNLKQGELADRLGCSRSNLSQIEHGVFFPGVSILDALSSTFNVSLDWLFRGRGSMFTFEKENVFDL